MRTVDLDAGIAALHVLEHLEGETHRKIPEEGDRTADPESRQRLGRESAEGAGRVAFLLHHPQQAVLRESGMLAAGGRGSVALHGIVNQMRAPVRAAKVDRVMNLLTRDVIERGAVPVVGEHHQTGETPLLHVTIEILTHAILRNRPQIQCHAKPSARARARLRSR